MTNLRDFSTAFTESLMARIRAMTESEATTFLRAIQASRKRQEETLASIRSISTLPSDEAEDLAELNAFLNSKPRLTQTGSDWFHYIEEAVRTRLKELGAGSN